MQRWRARAALKGRLCTFKKKMKCGRNSDILHEIVRDTTRKSEKPKLIHVVSRNISCSILETPLHFISLLTVWRRNRFVNLKIPTNFLNIRFNILTCNKDLKLWCIKGTVQRDVFLQFYRQSNPPTWASDKRIKIFSICSRFRI